MERVKVDNIFNELDWGCHTGSPSYVWFLFSKVENGEVDLIGESLMYKMVAPFGMKAMS